MAEIKATITIRYNDENGEDCGILSTNTVESSMFDAIESIDSIVENILEGQHISLDITKIKISLEIN